MSIEFTNEQHALVMQPNPNKTRITIRLDGDLINHFKNQVKVAGGGNYQTLINRALREHVETDKEELEIKLRNIIREELKSAL